MRIGSLFAGVGGFDLGFERAGFTTAWAVEIDPKAQAVLRLRFPHAELHDDVTKVGAHNLAPVDVITYGFPCQDLSVAGKRAGLEGARSGLFHEAVRVIRELRERDGKPDIAIAENVPGLFSSNGGEDFEVVLQTLLECGAKDVAWRVLDSRYARVAQRRRRVFIVSDFGGERAGEILSLAEGVRGDSAPRRKARKGAPAAAGAGASVILRIDGTRGGISGSVSCKWAKGTGGPSGAEFYNLIATETVGTLCSDSHPGAYAGQDAYTGRLVPMQARDEVISFHPTQDPISSTDGLMHALGTGSRSGCATGAVCVTGERTHALCAEGADASEDGTGRGTPIVPVAFSPLQGGRSMPVTPECPTLEAGTGNKTPAVLTPIVPVASMRESGQGYWVEDTVSGTLDANMGQSGHGNRAATIATSTMAVRRLTPTETNRLQAFPDSWNSEGIDKQGRRITMADSSRYKQMGNAVTVNVVEGIARRVWSIVGR